MEVGMSERIRLSPSERQQLEAGARSRKAKVEEAATRSETRLWKKTSEMKIATIVTDQKFTPTPKTTMGRLAPRLKRYVVKSTRL